MLALSVELMSPLKCKIDGLHVVWEQELSSQLTHVEPEVAKCLGAEWEQNNEQANFALVSLGVIHLSRPQENPVFDPLSTCIHMSRTPLPIVDVHMRSTRNTHRSLETASTTTSWT